MLAHGSEMTILLLFSAWLLGNIAGILAVVFSFIPEERNTTSVLWYGLPATAVGLILTFAAGWPRAIHWVYIASWCPLVLGIISLWRWRRRRL